jgi:uncharacterized protein YhhL (DUF1145 family)
MSGAKLGIGVVWVLCLLGFLFGSGSVASVGRSVFWLLAVAHVGEFLFFRSTLKSAGGSLAEHFFQTLLFGLFHIREVRDRVEGAQG